MSNPTQLRQRLNLDLDVASTVLEQHLARLAQSMNESTSTSTLATGKSTPEIAIRRATFTDAYAMSLLVTHEPLTKNWIWLPRLLVPTSGTRYHALRIQRRLLQPRNLNFVAVLTSDTDEMVGYVVFTRYGSDDTAQSAVRSNSSLCLWLFRCIWTSWISLIAYMLGAKIESSCDVDDDVKEDNDREINFWTLHHERWHVQHLFVRLESRRMGIATRLMEIVIRRATADKVPVTLKASAKGEKLYTKLGFTVLKEGYIEDDGRGYVCAKMILLPDA